MRENWMFKLVGRENFSIGKHKCVISIDAVNGFAYEYTLEVDGKSYEKFCENQSKILQSWTFRVKDRDYRVVLEKNTMDIWINGERLDVEVRDIEFIFCKNSKDFLFSLKGEFTENGTVTNFNISNVACQLTTISSGNRRSGLIHTLVVGNKDIAASNS